MSGHSKWENIKRKKGATDAARAKIFTKIIQRSYSLQRIEIIFGIWGRIEMLESQFNIGATFYFT